MESSPVKAWSVTFFYTKSFRPRKTLFFEFLSVFLLNFINLTIKYPLISEIFLFNPNNGLWEALSHAITPDFFLHQKLRPIGKVKILVFGRDLKLFAFFSRTTLPSPKYVFFFLVQSKLKVA